MTDYIRNAHGIEMWESFGSEPDAHAFGRLFKARTGGNYHVAPLMVGTEPTSYFRLTIRPARLMARAEDIRAGWRGYLDHTWDARDAVSTETAPLEHLQASETGPSGIGLTDAMRAFLEEARGGDASPWNHGANPVARAKRLGYVRPIEKKSPRDGVRYALTEEGAAALARTP